MIKFHCSCGKKLGVPDDWLGKHVKCPLCGKAVPVQPEAQPATADAAPTPPPVAAPAAASSLGTAPAPISLAPTAVASPLSYANADLPRKGGLAPVGEVPAGKPRNVLWLLLISITWLAVNVAFDLSFAFDLNRSNPNFARPLLLVLGWFLAGIGVLVGYLILVYALHSDIRRLTQGGYDISPAKAVGFSFIPGFSAFWVVYMPARLAGEVNRQLRAMAGAGGVSSGLVVALQVASIPLGLLVPALAAVTYSVTLLVIQRGLNEIWLRGAVVPTPIPLAAAPALNA